MTRALAGIVIISALAALILGLIALHATSPLLYNPSFDGSTPAHTNPAGLEKIGNDQAERLLPLMSDLLDSPGTVMVNIRYGDLDLAQRDLEEFSETARSFDTLVVNLDMTESEIEEFRRMNRKNLDIMTELLNSTSRMDELRTLEVRFRDSNDPQALTSITYEGESLRKKVRDLLTDYESQREPMTRAGEDLELNTTEYRESHQIFEEIVENIEAEQEIRTRELQTLAIPAPDPFHISLRVSPSVVRYHDTLVISGFLSGPDTLGSEIEIFVDSQRETSVLTDTSGSFSYRMRIESVSQGGHTVFATFKDSTFSDISSFTVETLPTTLTLAEPSSVKGGYSISGSLSAPDRPVSGAGVNILLDGKVSRKIVTGNDGNYRAVISLPVGDHDIRAVFSPMTLPLGPSESESRHVVVTPEDVPMTIPPLYSLLFGAIAIAVSSGGAYLYLKRRPGKPYPSPFTESIALDGTASLPPEDQKYVPEPLKPPLEIRAGQALEEYRREENARDAARLLFLFLRAEISARLRLRHEGSITAREMVRSSEGRTFFSPLRTFAQIYEKIRYDREIAGQEEKERMGSAFSATTGDLGVDEH
jgi:hypothetical protein